ncbi:MAG: alpha/beta hydrolase [Acidimicrobiales bacterium]
MTSRPWILASGTALAALVGRDGSVCWQLARVAAVAILTVASVTAAARLGDRGRGRMACSIGVVVVAVGAGFLPFLVKDAASIEAPAGLVAVVAGVGLVATGTLLRTRGRRRLRKIAAGTGMLVVTALVALVVSPAVLATNVPRPGVGATPASRGLEFETVTVTTQDGVDLAGWYLPSANRAAVVLLHGAGSTRSNVLDEAAVLARHEFGVLLLDARGHGDSEGRAMDFGWNGDADIEAATTFLAGREDVDPARIGAVGSSMGAEEAIGASGTNEVLRAVVAEGATARVASDEAWLSERHGLRGRFQEQLERAQDWVIDALTSAHVPGSLRSAVARAVGTRYLLITAGTVAEERHAAAFIASAAPARVDRWEVDGASHTAGLAVAPAEWEARVIDFLTEVLDPVASRAS